MDFDTLNTLVTSAIWRAEQLEDLGIDCAQAWAEVASVEAELAKILPASEPEGRLARRGAVRAALKALDYAGAYAMAEAFMAEKGPRSLKRELTQILDEDAKSMALSFRYAAARHSPREARELARRFRETGPFGLAAA